MTFQVIHSRTAGNARSPFRIVEPPMGREVEWVNRFLDREWVRRLAETTLRSYAMDLLHFLRWWAGVNHTDAISEGALSASVLLDYLRFQAGQCPQPAAATINRRVSVCGACIAQRVPRCSQPLRTRISPFLLAAFAAGLRPCSSGAEPVACEGTQTHRDALVSR